MPEPNDVTPASSTGEQVVEKPVEETTAQETTPVEQETPQASETPTPEGVREEGKVDERGVPWQNVAMEFKRKYTELESNLPTMLQQAVERAIPAQPVTQQPQYTEEQLIQFKNETDDPKARSWAEIELHKVEEKKTEQKFRNIIEEKDKKDRFEREQQMALGEVMRKYPLMFSPDGSWNNNHPLTQKIARVYNSRPTFKQDGMGLLGAADMAFAEYVLERQPELAKQTKQLKQQVKKLEKATLVEGGGQAVPRTSKTPLQAAKDALAAKKYTSNKDLKNVAMEYLKATGRLPKE